MKKILIIGLGSIGQRHANALLSLGIDKIAALRTGQGQKKVESELDQSITMFHDEEEAFKWNPTHLIISNPTSLHWSFVNKAIKNNIKFFVEKPITDNLQEVEIDQNYGDINGMVGYNLRFHGIFQFIKGLIDSKKFGSIVTAQIHVGQYLPNWHPYEDYRNAYYAKKELGGGALRTLSHEVDLLQFLFGKVQSVFAKVEHLSNLEIDVDDVTNIIATTQNCKQVSVHIDFLERSVQRYGTIYFSSGVLRYDIIKSVVTFIDDSGNLKEIYSEKEDSNRQYEAQIKEFLFEDTEVGCSFSEGMEVLKIIEKCIESNDEKREICIV